jgi:hypothetical protein
MGHCLINVRYLLLSDRGMDPIAREGKDQPFNGPAAVYGLHGSRPVSPVKPAET